MLTLSGKCLGITREIVNGPTGQFEAVQIVLQVGSGIRTRTEYARVAKAYDQSTLPKEGDDVVLEVIVSSFPTKAGAGHAYYAMSNVTAAARGARVAAVG